MRIAKYKIALMPWVRMYGPPDIVKTRKVGKKTVYIPTWLAPLRSGKAAQIQVETYKLLLEQLVNVHYDKQGHLVKDAKDE